MNPLEGVSIHVLGREFEVVVNRFWQKSTKEHRILLDIPELSEHMCKFIDLKRADTSKCAHKSFACIKICTMFKTQIFVLEIGFLKLFDYSVL